MYSKKEGDDGGGLCVVQVNLYSCTPLSTTIDSNALLSELAGTAGTVSISPFRYLLSSVYIKVSCEGLAD